MQSLTFALDLVTPVWWSLWQTVGLYLLLCLRDRHSKTVGLIGLLLGCVIFVARHDQIRLHEPLNPWFWWCVATGWLIGAVLWVTGIYKRWSLVKS